MFKPAPSSRLLNLTGFFSRVGAAALSEIDDISRVKLLKGALTKGCRVGFVAWEENGKRGESREYVMGRKKSAKANCFIGEAQQGGKSCT